MNNLATIWKKHPQWVLVAALAVLLLVMAFAIPPIRIVDKVDILPKHPSKQFPQRSLDQIKRIAVHHSASERQTAEDYARYHVQSNGWPGIGYHFVIELDGTIVQANRLTTISYNVADGNTPTIGICLSGHMGAREPSDAQLKSLGKLIGHLRRKLGRQLPVYGHRDLQKHKPTSCPGDRLYAHIHQYNKRLAA